MTWDMVLVTVTLITALLLILLLALISLIWQDETPRKLETSKHGRAASSGSAEMAEVSEQRKLLA